MRCSLILLPYIITPRIIGLHPGPNLVPQLSVVHGEIEGLIRLEENRWHSLTIRSDDTRGPSLGRTRGRVFSVANPMDLLSSSCQPAVIPRVVQLVNSKYLLVGEDFHH